jgi:hypothetical protein
MVLIVGIGLYPGPIFERLSPPLRQIVAGLDAAREQSESLDATLARGQAAPGEVRQAQRTRNISR